MNINISQDYDEKYMKITIVPAIGLPLEKALLMYIVAMHQFFKKMKINIMLKCFRKIYVWNIEIRIREKEYISIMNNIVIIKCARKEYEKKQRKNKNMREILITLRIIKKNKRCDMSRIKENFRDVNKIAIETFHKIKKWG